MKISNKNLHCVLCLEFLFINLYITIAASVMN